MTAPIASGWSESPGGACTHWKAPPLHRARRKRSFLSRQADLVIASISCDRYLMATLIPSSVKNFHGSKGEQDVFRALRALPDGIIIIHSFRWLHPGKHRSVTAQVGAQGEGDFVLLDPSQGIMVI